MFLVLCVYCLLNKCQSFCALAFLGSIEATKHQVSKKLCTVGLVSYKVFFSEDQDCQTRLEK